MALDAILGGAMGGIFRLAPEVIKLLDRKNERKHELALGEQQRKLVELQGHTQLETATLQTEASQFTASLEALRAAISSQGIQTGVKWVDALSASVRPVLTYGFSVCYLYYKMSTGTWGPEETAIFSGILNFWFLGRVFDTLKKTRAN